jgi:hypothetical protein
MSFTNKLETTDFEKLSKEDVVAIVKMCINGMKSRDILIEKLEEITRLLKETIEVKDRIVAAQNKPQKPTGCFVTEGSFPPNKQ